MPLFSKIVPGKATNLGTSHRARGSLERPDTRSNARSRRKIEQYPGPRRPPELAHATLLTNRSPQANLLDLGHLRLGEVGRTANPVLNTDPNLFLRTVAPFSVRDLL